jgi:hypothetical protein
MQDGFVIIHTTHINIVDESDYVTTNVNITNNPLTGQGIV